MKFKKLKEPVFTTDTYYDLFDGGYIKPSKMLKDPADAQRVEDAIKLITEFLEGAKNAGVLEEG